MLTMPFIFWPSTTGMWRDAVLCTRPRGIARDSLQRPGSRDNTTHPKREAAQKAPAGEAFAEARKGPFSNA